MTTHARGPLSFESSRDCPESLRDELPSYELQEIGIHAPPLQPIATWRSLFIFTTRRNVGGLVIAVIMSVAAGVTKPVAAIFFGNIITQLTNFGAGTTTGEDMLHEISKWCIALTVLGCYSTVVQTIFFSSWVLFGETQAQSARNSMFTGMLRKDMEWFDLREDGVGPLAIRIQTQIRELQLSVSQPLGFVVDEVAATLFSLGVAFYYTWKLTLVILAIFPVVAVVLHFVTRKLTDSIENQKMELTQASKFANTAITAIDTVKAFNGQNQEIWQYYTATKAAAVYYLQQAWINALQFGITKFAITVVFVQGFWYGLTLVDQGLTAGHVLTTFWAVLTAVQAIEVIMPQWLVLNKGMSAGETLETIRSQLARGRTIAKMDGSLKPESCLGDIEVKDVTFAYPSNPHQLSLKDATFFFPAGETTYIIGKSGSGKSTVTNLLLKFYEPSSGDIIVDGHSIQTLDSQWLRKNVTLVQQDSVLFNDTLWQNIEFASQGRVKEKDIAKACQVAELQRTIDAMSGGLETFVGKNGRQLSGGQKQRVSIARARLRDAPILILDEGTSALDHTNKIKVMANIREWRKGKTTIIITHDTSQILDDDYVYVMEHGCVIQEGYRGKIAEKEYGAFASFSPALPESEQIGVLDGARRHSEPGTPLNGSFMESEMEEASQPSNRFSSFFGISSLSPNHANISTPIALQSQRMSIGLASAYANDLRADTIWASPNLRRRPSVAAPLPLTSPDLTEGLGISYPSGESPVVTLTRPNYRNSFIGITSPKDKRFSAASIPRIRSQSMMATLSPSMSQDALNPFEDNFIGIADTEIRGESVSRPPASLTTIFKTVWPILDTKARIMLIIGFIAAFLTAVGTPGFSILFAKLLSEFYDTSAERSERALQWALLLLGVSILDGAAVFVMRYCLEFSAEAWVNSLRVEALKRILAQPKSWFDDAENSPGRLNECLDRNAEEMRNLIGRFAGTIFMALWMLGISIVWAFILSWKLTLVTLSAAPIMWIITRVFIAVSDKCEEDCNSYASKTNDTFTETFLNIRVVRALTLEKHFEAKHRKAALATLKAGRRRAIYVGAMYGLVDSTAFFVTALVFFYGTLIISRGEISVAACESVVNLLLFGIASASGMLGSIPQIGASRATATHMLHLANLPMESHETLGKQRISTPFPISLNALSFTYPSSHQPTLSNISFTLGPGSCIAVVGPSGGGKSTLTSMLLGLYPPDAPFPASTLVPALTLAGTSSLSIEMSSLRATMAIVSQTAVLFPTTIFANIVYGLPPMSQYNNISSCIQACMDAGIHDFISGLVNGYHTLIGEGGQGISGGQAQRIAIARALVRKPKLLILDEATSALDNESASVIRETVLKLRASSTGQGMAVFVISHSNDMMKIADKIVMIEGGEIVEEGGFRELLRKGGKFAELIGERKLEVKVAREEVRDGFVVGMGNMKDVFEEVDSPVVTRSKGTWRRESQ